MFTETTLVVLLDDDTQIIVSINDNLFSKDRFKKYLLVPLLAFSACYHSRRRN